MLVHAQAAESRRLSAGGVWCPDPSPTTGLEVGRPGAWLASSFLALSTAHPSGHSVMGGRCLHLGLASLDLTPL